MRRVCHKGEVHPPPIGVRAIHAGAQVVLDVARVGPVVVLAVVLQVVVGAWRKPDKKESEHVKLLESSRAQP